MCSVQRYFDRTYFRLNYGRSGLVHRTLRPLFRRDEAAIVRHCCDLLRPYPLSSVLDLGCGPGGLLEALCADHPIQEAVGVDFSHRVLERARERALRLPALSFEQASVERCRALNARFSAVLCVGVFDYLGLRPALLRAIVGAASSAVVLTVPRSRAGLQRTVRRLWLSANRVPLRAYRPEEAGARCLEAAPDGWEFVVDSPPGLNDNLWILGRRYPLGVQRSSVLSLEVNA